MYEMVKVGTSVVFFIAVAISVVYNIRKKKQNKSDNDNM